MEGKYLITTDAWFYAPDGQAYRSVWGNVSIIDDGILGIKTNRNSTNWYAKVGTETNHVIIAGCQIHYAVRCESMPNIEDVEDYNIGETVTKYNRPSIIYIAN